MSDDAGVQARRAGREALAAALQASRGDTLATFGRYAARLASGGFAVPRHADLNPPLWELGHVGWFQEWWLARNPERARGVAADPTAARPDGLRPGGDALYNSSIVAHDRRWRLPLPDAAATLSDLARQLERTLALLAETAEDDDALYFFRLALFHEDMHHEAALYMAQSLGIAIDDERWQPRVRPEPPPPLVWPGSAFRLGCAGAGFAFDNELAAHEVTLPGTRIDAQVVRWAEYLPFVDAGGYRERRWWSLPGWRWRTGQRLDAPRYLRRGLRGWEQRCWGRWQRLDLALPAAHLSAHEADAWCAWAGRRLPTEAEWERAATEGGPAFAWGDVWEWTASTFDPYPAFTAHPYRDYSAPWFGSRRVLRGGSHLTQPRMKHPRYRNYFEPGRNDVAAGLRSCEP